MTVEFTRFTEITVRYCLLANCKIRDAAFVCVSYKPFYRRLRMLMRASVQSTEMFELCEILSRNRSMREVTVYMPSYRVDSVHFEISEQYVASTKH